jgi:hypothetical protein
MERPATQRDSAIKLSLTLWHPGCWVLDVAGMSDVGLLGYGVFMRDDGRATTRYTVYGDDRESVEEGIHLIREHEAVYSVVEMTSGYRRMNASVPGNATRELLVEHDGTTQISEAFTSRGFTHAAPCDTHGDSESWTLFTNADRETVRERLAEIEAERDAEIRIESISPAGETTEDDPLPTDSLSHRQREVFRLARTMGYYRRPREASAGDVAAALDVTTSTFHEHLHKAEEKLLDLSDRDAF